jgi:tetratricopeptide (TPR) repeat protein
MAIEACDHAQRLSPFDPLDYWNAVSRAIVHLVAGRFEAAIECADRALRDQPRVGIAIRVKIAANAHLGRLDEARAELGRQLAIHPKLTIAGYRAFMAPTVAPEVCDLLVTGLRLAGLPEE